MTNDNAIIRLLYAILKQKCLKDIDWNKVARDEILQQEITNGHAARMRYSRFKKQMDGTAGVRKPRNPNSPRKPKVEKNKSPKKERIKNQKDSDDAEKLKEEVGVAGSSHRTLVERTPETSIHLGMDGRLHGSTEGSPLIKREPGSSGGSRYASTPLEEPTTPGSSFNSGAGEMSDMDDSMHSFGPIGLQSCGNGYDPMMSQGIMAQQQYSFDGLPMAIGNPYHGLYLQQQQQIEAEGGVLVKREPRWENTYRQV